MGKIIYLTQSVYAIVSEYPDVVEIMRDLGFESITKPGMLQTAGRVMTLSKGSQLKNIPLDRIKEVFNEKGYELRE